MLRGWFLCCRDLSSCEVGQCKYVLITDQDGGIINDPILLKLAEDHFWLSIADSDVLVVGARCRGDCRHGCSDSRA